MVYLIAILSVALGAAAQLLLKIGMSDALVQDALANKHGLTAVLTAARVPAIWLGFGCYGLSAVIWLLVLARLPVSGAYPFVSGGIVLVVVLGVALLGERVSVAQGIGLLSILLGLFLVSRG
jgi:drug/metabolite transporter (DMT)-like permease